MRVPSLFLFCYALLCVHSSIALILNRKRKLIALLSLSYRCIVTINVLWLFLMLRWVGLQYVIVVFPDHTHFKKFSNEIIKTFKKWTKFKLNICTKTKIIKHTSSV